MLANRTVHVTSSVVLKFRDLVASISLSLKETFGPWSNIYLANNQAARLKTKQQLSVLKETYSKTL